MDTDTLVAAGAELARGLVPGTVVKCRSRLLGTRAIAKFAGRVVQIELPDRSALVVIAPDDGEVPPVLQVATRLIKARADALAEKIELRESVEQLRCSERLQHALYTIADQASTVGADLHPMFQALHAIVGSLMYAGNFYIALHDVQRGTVSFPYFVDSIDPAPAFTPSGAPNPGVAEAHTWSMREIIHGPTWYVLHDGKALMGSLDSIARQVDGPFRGTGAECKDWLGVPLLHEGNVVGCVAVQSYDDSHHYNEQDKSLLTFVAQHIQTALERRLAHAELECRVEQRTRALSNTNAALQKEVLERRRAERLQASLFRIAELASTAESIDEFSRTAHAVVGDLLDARNFYIALLSDDGTRLTFPYAADERGTDFSPRKLSDGHGLTEYVLRNGQALLADDRKIAHLHASGEVAQPGVGSTCWLGVPLVCGEHTVGVLAIQSYTRNHRYTRQDQSLLTFVSYHIADALERMRAKKSVRQTLAQLEYRVAERTRDLSAEIGERKRIEARLKYETVHDSLTGLPNRTLFMQRLEQVLARYHTDPGKGFAVLFMDLDRFKVINDSEGHLVGDDLLIQAGARIRACIRDDDVVARIGGDEFCVLLESAGDVTRVSEVADRIIGDINAPFQLAGKELFTSLSVGVALAASHYHRPDELLRDADSAMYRAKADGRRRLVVFDDKLRQDVVSELEIENDLRRGLTRGEFVPYYQPIINVETGAVAGYEALMRWNHPGRGVQLPGAFLSVAEDAGISEAMDWQIFTQVCSDANQLLRDRGGFVSINLSAHHFSNPRLVRRLFALLDEHAVSPKRLCVEVTERTLLKNTPEVKRVLRAFRRAGIRISLDDFGTGYSSLSYLSEYPLQTLKIDQSFIAKLTKKHHNNNVAVVRAILALSDALDLQVVTEGVETPEQRDLLCKLGCRYVQGFLYARPKPADFWLHPERARNSLTNVA